MNTHTHFRVRWGSLLMGLALLAGCDDGSHPLAQGPEPEFARAERAGDGSRKAPVTVMTRNIYLGGDIGPILQVDFSNISAVVTAAAAVWAQVQANHFAERAFVLVDEIGLAEPDIVGLQEAVQFVHISAAAPEVLDYLQILVGEIDGRGLPYTLVEVQENTVVQLPVAIGMTPTGPGITEMVQMTERLAVLVRDDFLPDGISKGNYGAAVELPTAPGAPPIVLKRGWIRVDKVVDGVPHHFVNTHLEVQAFSPIQVAQTGELLNDIAGGLDGITYLMGDFNSNSEGLPGDPTVTPSYDLILGAGFSDAWAVAHPGNYDAGLTCCHDPDLSNALPGLDQRLDHVFYRISDFWRNGHHFPGPISVEIVGDDPAVKTFPDLLWPSDHAGLVADFQWAPGQLRNLR